MCNCECNFQLLAPVDGKVLDLSMVPDKIFSRRIVGDGVAIQPKGNIIVAPACGELSVVFKTNHAFGMILENKTEVLVHIGINTLELNGKGFERLAAEGSKVKVGDPIIKFDRNYMEKKGYSVIIPVIITNLENVSNINYLNINSNVKSGEDAILDYKL
jgi:sugar PTS system EIIA component